MSLLQIILIFIAASSGMDGSVREHIHPELEIESIFDSAEGEAMLITALDTLRSMEAGSIYFCRIHRIEAPLGGYLLDGLFNLTEGGREYTTFRIGVRDTGGVFAFFARGVTESDSVIWLPSVGPDWYHGSGEAPPEGAENYEFLLGEIERERFESLENRFQMP